jgi:hypothetical protein
MGTVGVRLFGLVDQLEVTDEEGAAVVRFIRVESWGASGWRSASSATPPRGSGRSRQARALLSSHTTGQRKQTAGLEPASQPRGWRRAGRPARARSPHP